MRLKVKYNDMLFNQNYSILNLIGVYFIHKLISLCINILI